MVWWLLNVCLLFNNVCSICDSVNYYRLVDGGSRRSIGSLVFGVV